MLRPVVASLADETARYLQLNLGRTFTFGRQRVDAGLGIFNVFNTGAMTQWNTGANRLNNSLYQSRFNRHPPRAFQMTLAYPGRSPGASPPRSAA